MTSSNDFRLAKRALIRAYAQPDNLKGLNQVLTTLVPLAGLWWCAAHITRASAGLAAIIVLGMILFNLRVFVLMHDCGHDSLFRTPRLNRLFGFVLGVVSGMPQYVWSRNHSFHHAHNGNWEKYRGPYTTLSVTEYASLSRAQQRMYRTKCSIALSPLVGFIYLIFNPRYTWIRGTLGLLGHVISQTIREPQVSIATHAGTFRTRYWKSPKEYRHMSWNNIAVLATWGALCWACGTGVFFAFYLTSVSLAGAIGIMLFTVQHNFEHSYAENNAHSDHDTAALRGTSFLILPAYLNWFTANIGYHHIHHLSARIPNYRLAECHQKYLHLFGDVRRLRLAQIPCSLKCILWDTSAARIISVAEYRLQLAQELPPAHQPI